LSSGFFTEALEPVFETDSQVIPCTAIVVLADSPAHTERPPPSASTNPDADKAGMPALAHHAPADEKSWAAMLKMLGEVFGK
jgi:hypothetical protein